jgi:hypothetical protein
VEHFISYYSAQHETALSTGRVYQTASVLQNTFTWDSSLLSGSGSWASAFASDLSQYNLGNDPSESASPPTITIGQNLSIDPAGAYGNPRYIWSVGGYLPGWGKDAQGNWKVPLFVDPKENAITVQGNTATIANSGGSTTPRTEPTGQVYEGTVNGTTVSGTIAAMTYNGNIYFPFNLNDYPSLYGANSLNIYGGSVGPNSRILVIRGSGGSSPHTTQANAQAGTTTVKIVDEKRRQRHQEAGHRRREPITTERRKLPAAHHRKTSIAHRWVASRPAPRIASWISKAHSDHLHRLQGHVATTKKARPGASL